MARVVSRRFAGWRSERSTDPQMDYALLYERARKAAGMTQQDLSDELGVGVQTIKRVESGKRIPKRGELIAVAVVTGVPLSFFSEDAAATQLEILARIQRDLGRPLDEPGREP
jgi:transcriptional regulator with XRE-family HTH domain